MIDKASLPPVVEKPIIVNETMAEYLAPADNKETLIKQLKAYRLEKSREENIKAYCVFSNKQMLDLIDKMPKSRDELLGVSGFGPVKAEKYGDVIIELLK
ncbi:HRDC domain-containing protein [Acetobacterium bakii]|nr:HRDC domain-containing protein [Acetobacterium bakii]